MHFRKTLLLALFTNVVFGQSFFGKNSSEDESPKKWFSGARFNTGAFYQNDLHFFWEGDLFIPAFWSRNSLIFIDVRALDYRGPSFEGNIGVGLRRLFSDRYIIGGYVFFDRKKSPFANFFNQITVGAEFRTDKWMVGVNGYIPFGTTSYAEPAFNQSKLSSIQANGLQNILFVDGQEKALWGFDAEAGYTYKDLTVYLGGYYFDRSNVSTIAGPRLRATYSLAGLFNILKRPFDDLIVEGSVHWDKPRGWQGYIGLRVFVYFGSVKGRKVTGVHRRMLDYVRRDLDVVTGGNDKAPFKPLMNGNNAVMAAVATTESEITNGINNGATVVGVKGEVPVTSKVDLKDDVVLTGGDWVYKDSSGSTQKVAIGEKGKFVMGSGYSESSAIELKTNNEIRDLEIQNESTTADVTILKSTSTSVGNMTMSNVTVDATNSTKKTTLVEITANTTTLTDAQLANNEYTENIKLTTLRGYGLEDGVKATMTGLAAADVEATDVEIEAVKESWNLDASGSTGFGRLKFNGVSYYEDAPDTGKDMATIAGNWDISMNNVSGGVADGSTDVSVLHIKTMPGQTIGITGWEIGDIYVGNNVANVGFSLDASAGGEIYIDSIKSVAFTGAQTGIDSVAIRADATVGTINFVQSENDVKTANSFNDIDSSVINIGNVNYNF